jgi:hypothetical protein
MALDLFYLLIENCAYVCVPFIICTCQLDINMNSKTICDVHVEISLESSLFKLRQTRNCLLLVFKKEKENQASTIERIRNCTQCQGEFRLMSTYSTLTVVLQSQLHVQLSWYLGSYGSYHSKSDSVITRSKLYALLRHLHVEI